MKPEQVELEKKKQIKKLYDASNEADKAKIEKYLHTEGQEVDHVDD